MSENRLSILTYHAIDGRPSVTSVAPGKFRRQMEFLASHGLVGISLAKAFAHHTDTGCFPERSITLTFDDGFLSVFQHAYPVMKALGFSGTVFIPTNFVGLDGARARAANAGHDRDLMTWSQLEELQKSGFEIGAHSSSHKDLTQIGADEVERELAASRQCLEQHSEQAVHSFAYPYGRYNQSIRNAAAGHYRQACTTELGHNYSGQDALLLKRLDAYFLSREQLFVRACKGGLGAYWNVRQALRDLKSRFQ